MLYTPKKLEQLQQAIKHLCPQWGLDYNAPISLLNISENATFLYGYSPGNHDDNTHIKRRIIRAYRPFYHDNDEIHSELIWMQSLEKENIVPLPHVFPRHVFSSHVPLLEANGSKQKDSLFASMSIDGVIWRFAVFSYLEGKQPNSHDDLSDWFFTLGAISARLHIQAQNWHRPAGFKRKYWTFDTMIGNNAYWGDWKKIPNLSNQDFATLQLCVDNLKNIEPTFARDKAHFGLIHGDLRLANLLVHNNRLCILDFDDCGFSWYASDLANALSFMEDDPSLPTFIESWFKGYSTIRAVLPTMQNMLPHLIMMRRLQLSAWLVSHKDSSPLQELGNTFHQTTVKLASQYIDTKHSKNTY